MMVHQLASLGLLVGHVFAFFIFESPGEKTCLRGFRHKPGCISAEVASRLKLWSYEVEGLYYLCSENKGADQLRSYCAADLRLCFRIDLCKKPVFS